MMETRPTGRYLAQPMRQMSVTFEEMGNIASQLPLDLTMSHAFYYDVGEQMLHYTEETAPLVECANKKMRRVRVPQTITSLQAHLEIASRDIVLADALAAVPQQYRVVTSIIWQRAPDLKRDDPHVVILLETIGLNVDEFFIAAGRRS